MGKRKSFTRPKVMNPEKKKIEEKRIAKKTIDDAFNKQYREKMRMAWAFIIAMDDIVISEDLIKIEEYDEVRGYKLSPDVIGSIVETMSSNMDEYAEIVKSDGEDVADEKLLRRVNKILGEEPGDTPEQLYNPTC